MGTWNNKSNRFNLYKDHHPWIFYPNEEQVKDLSPHFSTFIDMYVYSVSQKTWELSDET